MLYVCNVGMEHAPSLIYIELAHKFITSLRHYKSVQRGTHELIFSTI
jgi:hypothetical protein